MFAGCTHAHHVAAMAKAPCKRPLLPGAADAPDESHNMTRQQPAATWSGPCAGNTDDSWLPKRPAALHQGRAFGAAVVVAGAAERVDKQPVAGREGAICNIVRGHKPGVEVGDGVPAQKRGVGWQGTH